MKVAKKEYLSSILFRKISIDFKALTEVVEYEMYQNLFKLLKLAPIMPMSSASCERSFPTVRRIKNFGRVPQWSKTGFQIFHSLTSKEVFLVIYQLMNLLKEIMDHSIVMSTSTRVTS